MIAALRLCIGFALVGVALWLVDAGDVLSALRNNGWLAVLAMSAYHIVPLTLCGVAWSIPLAAPQRGGRIKFIYARWIRDAINQILPLFPLGGEVLGARVLSDYGLPGSTAAALTVADVTAELLSQVVFSFVGAGLWLSLHPSAALPPWAWAGLLIMLPMGLGFLAAQKLGLVQMLERIGDKVMPTAWRRPDEAGSIHDQLTALYARRSKFWAATAVHLLAWLAPTVEAWIALVIIGHPLAWGDVLILESVIYAVRASAFVVPAAVGVQEGAYVLVGTLLGLPPDVALALALIKRGRELCMGLPAILAWQFFARRARA